MDKAVRLALMKLMLLLTVMILTPTAIQAQSFFEDFLAEEEAKERDQAKATSINQYDSKYRKFSGPVTRQQGLLGNAYNQISFLRTANTPTGFATLQFAQNINLSGCATLSQDILSAEKRGKTLIVTLPRPAPSLNKDNCIKTAKTPGMSVQINREDIDSGEIKKLRIESSAGQKETFDLYTTEHTLQLTSETGATDITYWFYPEDLIILSAPNAQNAKDITPAIQKLANQRGLVPATDMLEGFTPPQSGDDGHKSYYFIDPSKKLATILKRGQPEMIDTLTVQETFLGSEGAYNVPRDVQIFARKPGLYD